MTRHDNVQSELSVMLMAYDIIIASEKLTVHLEYDRAVLLTVYHRKTFYTLVIASLSCGKKFYCLTEMAATPNQLELEITLQD